MKKLQLLRVLCIGTLSLSTLVGCKKEDEKPTYIEPEDDVKEDIVNDEITVDEIIKNPSAYINKEIKVKGFLPNEIFYDDKGDIVVYLESEMTDTRIEVIGEFPTSFFCLIYVSGRIVNKDGIPVLEATDYEVIEQYQAQYDPEENYGATVYGPPSDFE